MYKDLAYDEIDENYVLVDVRTPKEHNEFTIPGSINIPVFSDEERERIGTVYKQESIEKAKRMGVEAASKRLLQLYDDITNLEKKHKKNIVFFCARGGFRSAVLTNLMAGLGVKAYKLRGGYKGYRAYINKNLPKVNKELKYIVLQGNTGVGKTEILKKLQEKGYDTLDLEACANHRGSLLGSVGIGGCNTQKQFEALVYHSLTKVKSGYVFVEGESKRIGNIIIPDCIYDNVVSAKHILVEADIDYRATNIVKEYTMYEKSKEEIVYAINKLRRYINEERINNYLELIEENKYEEVAEDLMIKYYDPMYKSGEKKYKYEFSLKVSSIEDACYKIEKWFKVYLKNK